MRRTHMTKIVATLGPSSSSEDKIRALFEAGVDVFRLNFSHGSQDDHRQSIAAIRMIEQATKRPIAIMMDLQGPKLRVGDFSESAALLEPGQPFRFDMDSAPGDADRVSLHAAADKRLLHRRARLHRTADGCRPRTAPCRLPPPRTARRRCCSS